MQPFERVVTEHGATVLRVCRAVLGPGDAADDAWSETFLAALRAYPDLRPGSDVRAWLVTIAHRKAVDQVRRQARAPVPVGSPPEPAVWDDEPADRDALGDRLGALTRRQRAAVAYRYLADLPYTEVAALLGASVPAARRSAADGIARLRSTYGKDRST
jgi:RNA polymerase sigma factor (sigma-70 family)